MNPIITFILGIIVGFAITQLTRKAKPDKIKDSRVQEKEDRKQKIIAYLEFHKRAKNDDIEQLLDVADSTATKYLQELETKKKIRQIGGTGRNVHYELR